MPFILDNNDNNWKLSNSNNNKLHNTNNTKQIKLKTMTRQEMYNKWVELDLFNATRLTSGTPLFNLLAECTKIIYKVELCGTCSSQVTTYWKLIKNMLLTNASTYGWSAPTSNDVTTPIIEESPVLKPLEETEPTFKPKSYGKKKNK
jgi:hypothetical protein